MVRMQHPASVARDAAHKAVLKLLGAKPQHEAELSRAVQVALRSHRSPGFAAVCTVAVVGLLGGTAHCLLRYMPQIYRRPRLHMSLTTAASAELLIFACSPRVAPLPEAGSEATDVAMATSWGDAVHISFGGDAERLRHTLITARPRRFLFTGHSDVIFNGGEKTLGFTKPGGTLELVETELVAQILASHGVNSGGLLELAFINGCRSEALGRMLATSGVPCVVCWRGRVCDGAARVFARAFFQAVAGCMSYERAFVEAKRAVLLVTRRSGGRAGTAVATPLYELRDPDTAVQGADQFRGGELRQAPSPLPHAPRKIAAGVPIILVARGSDHVDETT